MSKISLDRLTSQFGFQAAFNSVLKDIEDEFSNRVLYRDNPAGEPNSMNNDIDMAGNDLINVGTISASDFRVNGQDLSEAVSSLVDQIDDAIDEANAAVIAAEGFADEAESWANAAQVAATTVAYNKHEGILLEGERVINLPWPYDVSVGVEVFLSGVKQAYSTLVFTATTTVTLVDAVSEDTPYEVVSTSRAQSELGTQLADPSGSALVGFLQSGTGAVARTVQYKLRDIVSVKDFGAVGDGITDDTVSIQAALSSLTQYSTLYFPAGQYLVSSTLTLRTSYVSLLGDGSGATTILRTNGDYGDTFFISPANPTVNTFLLSVTVRGIKIRSNVEMNSGAHLRLSEVTQSQFSDVFLEDGFIGIHIEGVRNTHFDGIKIESGKYFATTKTGSRFVLIEDSPKVGQENTEIFFDSFNWTFTINATVEYGLELKESDGIWFSNGHILGAATADCLINLASAAQLVGLQFDNVFFDGFTKNNVIISNTPTGTVKELNFNNCVFAGSTQYAVWATATSVFEDISFTGCSFTSSDGFGVRISGGNYWSFTGCDFADINRAGAVGSYAILATVDSEINVSGGHIGKVTAAGDELDYGIQIATTGTKFNINGVSFWNIQINEVEVPTTAELKGWVGNCTTDRSNYNVVTLASNVAVVPAIAVAAHISGTGPVNTIFPIWEGRRVLMVGSGSSFIMAHASGVLGQLLFNSGANTTLAPNRGKLLQYFDIVNSWLDVQ